MECDLQEILSLLKEPKEADVKIIEKAYTFAKNVHNGQERFSGEPYFSHPFETAKILASLHLDTATIAAGLLHDIIEDTAVTEKDIRKEFGEEILNLIKGATKLGKLKYHGVERHVENLRKLFLAMARDIRVILIKLADRLHNMRTLQYVREEKRKRIALDTFEIYVPLANRLGMGYFKGELEDLVFPYLHPEQYKIVKKISREKIKESEKHLLKVKHTIETELAKDSVKPLSINKRVKRLWSLYKKLKDNEMQIERVYDLAAMRIIVENVEDCYRVLGIIHKIWKPLPGRIKDYIALPKLNGYQSLHTTVFTDKGKIVEIQIRTAKMHKEAEYGIAAHWAYKENVAKKSWVSNPKLAWVNQLLDWQKDVSNPEDFLENLRIDFFEDRVFTFTPKGDVIDLPKGSTVIDFAYAIHSAIGNKASGAKINEKFSSLDTILNNGDIVEVQTIKDKKPNIVWLKNAKTTLAKKQIKLSLKKYGYIPSDTPEKNIKNIEKIEIIIKAENRVGLLKDVASVFSEFRANIENTNSRQEGEFKIINLLFTPKNHIQFDKIKSKLENIKKVREVTSRIRL
ncbi:MAG: RelA/SpoT family protein [Patescibacteria group bacterium]|nr:RelA/SpoT family protein [Patescibacteria group bacterium]